MPVEKEKFMKATMSASQNFPAKELKIETVDNCIITRSLMVVTIKGVARPSLFENLPPRGRRQLSLVAVASVFKNKLHRLAARDDYYFVMNIWAKGYHHWLAEVAPKFIVFEKLLRSGKILMPADRPPFISEFLEMFEFDNVVDISDNTYVKTLNIVTNPYSGHFDLKHITMLRDAILSRTNKTGANGTRKIYVTRKNARARKVVNETEVVKLLDGLGFELVELENVSFRDQVSMFAECGNFISIHGGALTNAIFMPTGGNVFELYPKFENRERELNACYERLSTTLGHQHRFVFCDRKIVGKKRALQVDDIMVDLPELETVVRSQLR